MNDNFSNCAKLYFQWYGLKQICWFGSSPLPSLHFHAQPSYRAPTSSDNESVTVVPFMRKDDISDRYFLV
jgi:hypothetical protein